MIFPTRHSSKNPADLKDKRALRRAAFGMPKAVAILARNWPEIRAKRRPLSARKDSPRKRLK